MGTLYVYLYVCVYVYPNEKKVLNRFENFFFSRKVWTLGVTWAILEVSNTTPSCRKPDKPPKNGFFWTSETVLRKIYRLISTKMDPMSHKGNNKKFWTNSWKI